tara:strand:+ start:553 stop:888 length:336 start_codon:yes stop_codon:yes gene_type:complete
MNRSIKQNSAFFGKKIGDVIQGNFTNNRYIIAKEVLGWDKWSLSRIRVISAGGQPKLHIDRLINTQFKSEIFNYIDNVEEEYSKSQEHANTLYQSGMISAKEYDKRLGGSI